MTNQKYFGVMLDMSRNAVMKVDKIKLYVDYLVKMGYNMLQLYTEDTFEVNNEPYFGYMRGRFTKSELKELDAYCKSKGVELIPCTQALAHLNCIFKWETYNEIKDADDILLIDEDRTYTLLDNMFSTLRECFSSNYINIGMDEAHMVGLGKYLDKHGYHDRFEIINKHLQKVIDLANKYGFKPTMWSDMFFRLVNHGDYYGNNKISKEDIAKVPTTVDLVYWDYYHTDLKLYRNILKRHKMFNQEIWFAGGTWTWCGFAPELDFSLKTMKPAIKAVKEAGIDKIFFTMWGDDGSECSYFATLPVLYLLKQYYDGVTDLKTIKQGFKDAVGEDFDAFMTLQVANSAFKWPGQNRNKYLFYSDLFNFIHDDYRTGKEYSKLIRGANKLKKYAKESKFKLMFEYEADFARALATKFDLPIKIREAYEKGDKQELANLTKVIAKTIKSVKTLYNSYRAFWYDERNPFGFDVQDARIGGLIMRMQSCLDRINDYVSGKIQKIDELEVKKLPYNGDYASQGFWRGITTVNRIW